MFPEPLSTNPDFPVQTGPKGNVLPFSCFPLSPGGSCAVSALPQRGQAVSEPMKTVSRCMAQGVPLGGKIFQKDLRPLVSLSLGHKWSVIPRVTRTRGSDRALKPGLAVSGPSLEQGKVARPQMLFP